MQGAAAVTSWSFFASSNSCSSAPSLILQRSRRSSSSWLSRRIPPIRDRHGVGIGKRPFAAHSIMRADEKTKVPKGGGTHRYAQ